MDIISPMVNEVTVHFARPDALKGSLKNTLQECQPTVFFGVPRVWEKFREAILAKAKDLYSVVAGRPQEEHRRGGQGLQPAKIFGGGARRGPAGRVPLAGVRPESEWRHQGRAGL